MRRSWNWRSEAVNMVAAGILTLLVWAYANDRTREYASLAGTARLTPADPRAQWVEPTTAVQVSVEARGSRRALEALADALRSGLALSPGSEGVPGDAGTHERLLREVLAASPAVIATGAEVVRVRPESLRYECGALVTEQVPVSAILPMATVRGEITVDPPVVALTLPETARRALGALSVDAAIDTKNLEPGVAQQVDVELRLPASLGRWQELCRVVPPRAKVGFELLGASGQWTAPSIPVRVAIGPAAAGLWEIEPERGSEAIEGVVLNGPRAAIDSLVSGGFVAAAVVDLGDGPPPEGTADYPVSFWRLPEGVTVAKVPGGDQPTVRLRVAPRRPAAPR